MEARASSDLNFILIWNITFIIMWPLHNQSYCNISMKNWSNVIIDYFCHLLINFTITNYFYHLLFRDRPFNLQGGGGGLWVFVSFRIFFLDNTRVRILIFFVTQNAIFFLQHTHMTKSLNSESDYYFFPPPQSEYFFQQHWESEYFFRKKPYINGHSLTFQVTLYLKKWRINFD